ncbi:MAG: hypothetical protein ACKV0T_30500 [Planctomycetales bacterium]
MADNAATNNAFLDTEVFDCHQFDFGALSFRRLVRLAADGPMSVFLTTVTVSEIRKHIGGTEVGQQTEVGQVYTLLHRSGHAS